MGLICKKKNRIDFIGGNIDIRGWYCQCQRLSTRGLSGKKNEILVYVNRKRAHTQTHPAPVPTNLGQKRFFTQKIWWGVVKNTALTYEIQTAIYKSQHIINLSGEATFFSQSAEAVLFKIFTITKNDHLQQILYCKLQYLVLS